jgi:hypothetical protein
MSRSITPADIAPPPSNSPELWRWAIGKRVVGVIHGAPWPLRGEGASTLVLDCGRSITINGNGAYWANSREDTTRAIETRRAELQAATAALADVVALAEGRTLAPSPAPVRPIPEGPTHG